MVLRGFMRDKWNAWQVRTALLGRTVSTVSAVCSSLDVLTGCIYTTGFVSQYARDARPTRPDENCDGTCIPNGCACCLTALDRQVRMVVGQLARALNQWRAVAGEGKEQQRKVQTF